MEKILQFIRDEPYSQAVLWIIFGTAEMLAPYCVIALGAAPPTDVIEPIVYVGKTAFWIAVCMIPVRIICILIKEWNAAKKQGAEGAHKR